MFLMLESRITRTLIVGEWKNGNERVSREANAFSDDEGAPTEQV